MTDAALEKLVREWQKRLGLEHWRIEVDFEEQTHEDGPASAWRSDDYDTARIQFKRDERGKWTDEEAAQNVVHELLHLVTRDLDEAASLPRQPLGEEAARVARDAWLHEYEGAVDRLAWMLVRLAK